MKSGGKRYVHHASSTVLSVALALGLVACDQGPPSEKVGKGIDGAIDQDKRGREQAASIGDGKIAHASGTISETAAAGGESADDAALSMKVKSALSAEPGLRHLAVDVNASSGAVTLYGTANSYSLRDKAAQVALNVHGVKSVTNHLIILEGS